ncbi:MAG TPA: hypothetical protein VMZ91_14445 [Candidatus Paceibacterota bacterium]|nr:hypothetical protein [Candidatus Paceibacterota bacterium]
MKFKVYYSGTGDAEEQDPEILDFKNKKQAEDYAYDQAMADLEQYGGLHGYPDPEEDDFEDEAQSWIDWKVVPITDKKNIKEEEKKMNFKDKVKIYLNLTKNFI